MRCQRDLSPKKRGPTAVVTRRSAGTVTLAESPLAPFLKSVLRGGGQAGDFEPFGLIEHASPLKLREPNSPE